MTGGGGCHRAVTVSSLRILRSGSAGGSVPRRCGNMARRIGLSGRRLHDDGGGDTHVRGSGTRRPARGLMTCREFTLASDYKTVLL